MTEAGAGRPSFEHPPLRKYVPPSLGTADWLSFFSSAWRNARLDVIVCTAAVGGPGLGRIGECVHVASAVVGLEHAAPSRHQRRVRRVLPTRKQAPSKQAAGAHQTKAPATAGETTLPFTAAPNFSATQQQSAVCADLGEVARLLVA